MSDRPLELAEGFTRGLTGKTAKAVRDLADAVRQLAEAKDTLNTWVVALKNHHVNKKLPGQLEKQRLLIGDVQRKLQAFKAAGDEITAAEYNLAVDVLAECRLKLISLHHELFVSREHLMFIVAADAVRFLEEVVGIREKQILNRQKPLRTQD